MTVLSANKNYIIKRNAEKNVMLHSIKCSQFTGIINYKIEWSSEKKNATV